MTSRARVAAFTVVCLIVVGATNGYILWQASSRQDAAEAAGSNNVAITKVASIDALPRIVFRNTAPGPDNGKVAMVAATDPTGPRAVTDTKCDRVDANGTETRCLVNTRGIAATYAQGVTGVDGTSLFSVDRAGIPSRARLSSDGPLAAVTGFVTGDSYMSAGFSPPHLHHVAGHRGQPASRRLAPDASG